jgi:acylphosphatase
MPVEESRRHKAQPSGITVMNEENYRLSINVQGEQQSVENLRENCTCLTFSYDRHQAVRG